MPELPPALLLGGRLALWRPVYLLSSSLYEEGRRRGGEVLLYGIPTNILLLNSNEAVPWQEVGYRGSYWGVQGVQGVWR